MNSKQITKFEQNQVRFVQKKSPDTGHKVAVNVSDGLRSFFEGPVFEEKILFSKLSNTFWV